MSKWPRIILLSALFAALASSGAEAATARASGAPAIYAGPGYGYAVIGRLAPNEAVSLAECTPRALWCRIVHDGPGGWVLGSFLVGAAAKVNATPWQPLVNPFSHRFHRHPFP
jgi:uncharacterized protein YraI